MEFSSEFRIFSGRLYIFHEKETCKFWKENVSYGSELLNSWNDIQPEQSCTDTYVFLVDIFTQKTIRDGATRKC